VIGFHNSRFQRKSEVNIIVKGLNIEKRHNIGKPREPANQYLVTGGIWLNQSPISAMFDLRWGGFRQLPRNYIEQIIFYISNKIECCENIQLMVMIKMPPMDSVELKSAASFLS
jgi:hypothetical protein